MKLTEKAILSSIKHKPFPLYWLCGDEHLILDEALQAIRREAKACGFASGVVFDLNQGIDWQQLLMELKSYSLFSEKSLIEIRLNEKKLPEQGRKLLASYLENPALDKIILVTSAKLDAATLKTKWFKAIEANSGFLQIWPITLNELPRWTYARLQSRGLSASKEALELLVAKSEGNLLALAQEIEKLKLCYPNAKLDVAAIQEYAHDNARYDIFTLVDAALAQKPKRVIKILDYLKVKSEEPILILWALVKDIRLLLSIYCSGKPVNEATLKSFGVWNKRMPLLKAALAAGTKEMWQELIVQGAQVDEFIKGAQLGEVWDELKSLSLKLAGVKL